MQGTLTSPTKSADRRILLLALVLGAIAAGLIVAFLSSRESSKGEGQVVATLSVVVAAKDIGAGQKITDSMVELKALPETAVINDAATAKSQVVDQTLRYPVAKGEQLSSARLVEPPKVKTLSFQIPPGLRGFTVPVSVNNSPAALLAPGDFVDILVVVDVVSLGIVPQGTQQGGSTPAGISGLSSADLKEAISLFNKILEGDKELKGVVTLLQNIQVLSVQRDYVDNGVTYDASVRGEPTKDGKVSYVTLAVTPEQAQYLWLAADKGKITLALRPFGEGDIKDLAPITEPIKLR